ncbi:DUF11 domain-containing protein [Runella sp. CRIBMP]|nr:DUF11 domain-containing protein [Runella sp. CRIBMP]
MTASLPAGCTISTQKDLGGDDTKDSDIDPTTGLSPVIVIDALGTGIAKDNMTVDAALYSPKGSIGDYVWKDADNNGVQDATEAPVAGVIVQLLQGTTVVATDTTDASGLYLFSNLSSGSYQVKILTASLPAGCTISTQKDLGGDDTKDSDIDPTTGLSPVIVIDALGTGIAKDNLTVDAALYSPKGSIGDYVWKDADNDGVQDATEAPVAGVIVQLLQGTTVVATDTTDASGLYLFSNLSSGSYQVKILTASLPAGCTISTQKDLGGDDTKDSDFDPTTGLSPVIVIDALGTGIAKDNMTVDAALYSPCVKPDAGPDQTLVCATTAPSTANLVDAATGQKWKVLSVQPNTTVTVTTPAGDVMGMTAPGTYRFVLQTQSDSLACRDTVSIIVPDCSCPQVNILTPNATVCKDSLFPTLSIALLGSNTQGVSAAWYANATGGSSLGTGLSFKPAGTASVTDTFYVALTGASANCLALPRTPVIVTVQNCSVEIDLALKKSINIKIAQIGDELTYTIKVFNQLNVPATGVEVTDSIAATVQFVAGSFVASRGSATIVGNVIKWNIGGIAANAGANGDTVTLTYKVKATQEGVHFNTAEISKTNEKDVDSTPGDGKLGEDDIESQCFTVPFKLCPTEKVEVNVPAFLTNVQWFKDGGTAPIAAGSTVLLTELGTYTYTASNQICPANGCCPIIIEPGVNCCPEDLCIPFTIQKVKKK